MYYHIEGNSFTGTVPKEIGDLANLKTLNAGSNNLEGSLPVELGNLDGLENFDIGKDTKRMVLY